MVLPLAALRLGGFALSIMALIKFFNAKTL